LRSFAIPNLRAAAADHHIDMAAGYLNFPRVYEEAVLASRAGFTIMTAHPKVPNATWLQATDWAPHTITAHQRHAGKQLLQGQWD
jgi:hypothetical protein